MKVKTLPGVGLYFMVLLFLGAADRVHKARVGKVVVDENLIMYTNYAMKVLYLQKKV